MARGADRLPTAAMANALRRGYATASTDTGHTGNTARFALGHPEKLTISPGDRVHEMTIRRRASSSRFTRAAKFSYWTGCSAGGRQAMKEAQMFPADYDGIVAGSPGLGLVWTIGAARARRACACATTTPAAAAGAQLLHAAVLRACDANDGVKDGLIEKSVALRFRSRDAAVQGAQVRSAA